MKPTHNFSIGFFWMDAQTPQDDCPGVCVYPSYADLLT